VVAAITRRDQFDGRASALGFVGRASDDRVPHVLVWGCGDRLAWPSSVTKVTCAPLTVAYARGWVMIVLMLTAPRCSREVRQ
jgi:hypothetical protein